MALLRGDRSLNYMKVYKQYKNVLAKSRERYIILLKDFASNFCKSL